MRFNIVYLLTYLLTYLLLTPSIKFVNKWIQTFSGPQGFRNFTGGGPPGLPWNRPWEAHVLVILNHPGLHSTAWRSGFEHATYRSQVLQSDTRPWSRTESRVVAQNWWGSCELCSEFLHRVRDQYTARYLAAQCIVIGAQCLRLSERFFIDWLKYYTRDSMTRPVMGERDTGAQIGN